MCLLESAASALALSVANVSGKCLQIESSPFCPEAGINPEGERGAGNTIRVFKTLAEQLRAGRSNRHSNPELDEGLDHFPKLPLRSIKTEYTADELKTICALFCE